MSSQWFDQVWHDERFALRTMRTRPGIPAAVILTLALGISMSTVVISVYQAVVMRPVAFPHPERLAWLATSSNEEEQGIVGEHSPGVNSTKIAKDSKARIEEQEFDLMAFEIFVPSRRFSPRMSALNQGSGLRSGPMLLLGAPS